MSKNKLPEQVKYRTIQPPKVICPLHPNSRHYGINQAIKLSECVNCEYHRGENGNVVACAYRKDKD